MIEEILANLHKVEIPLPKNPFKAVNSYVIKNSKRNLIIDTGWNQEEAMSAMQTGLRELGVDITKHEFDLEFVLPGHRGVFRNCSERIRELKDYHKSRLDEIISILEKGSQNAFQIASQMG